MSVLSSMCTGRDDPHRQPMLKQIGKGGGGGVLSVAKFSLSDGHNAHGIFLKRTPLNEGHLYEKNDCCPVY